MPKMHEKAIVRLDADEVAMLLDYVESAGSKLTGQALVYYRKTKDRDLAILTLLLGTGIRVSECVGLDLNDVDFKTMELLSHGKAAIRWSFTLATRWRWHLRIISMVTGKL